MLELLQQMKMQLFKGQIPELVSGQQTPLLVSSNRVRCKWYQCSYLWGKKGCKIQVVRLSLGLNGQVSFVKEQEGNLPREKMQMQCNSSQRHAGIASNPNNFDNQTGEGGGPLLHWLLNHCICTTGRYMFLHSFTFTSMFISLESIVSSLLLIDICMFFALASNLWEIMF